jgi:putative phosphoribosyl transferase
MRFQPSNPSEETMARIRNRETAARLLALRLGRLRGVHALVLAVPRGGVPMGRIIATDLDADLDVVLVRKLGAPGQPEFAVGAVNEQGEVILHPSTAWMDEAYLEQEVRKQCQLLRQRRALFTPGRGPQPIEGRTVVLVDDGVATGATLEAAILAVRRHRPLELIVAAGVISGAALRHFERLADRVVCLIAPEDLRSVGEYYADFRQVSDDEVVDALRASEADHALSRHGGA